MTNSKFEFRQPPTPAKGRNNRVAKFVEVLRSHPGQWAVYCVNDSATTAYSKAQKYKVRYPGTQWSVRKEADGYTVFGCWRTDQ